MSVSRISNTTAAAQTAGLHIIKPTSVVVGSGTGSVADQGAVTFSGASSVSLNGCFSANYDNYLIRLSLTSVGVSGYQYMRMRNSTDETTSNYNWSGIYNTSGGVTPTGEGGGAVNYWAFFYMSTGDTGVTTTFSMHNPFQAAATNLTSSSVRHAGGSASVNYHHAATKADSTSYSGFTIYPSSSTVTGTIRVYGYNNGGA